MDCQKLQKKAAGFTLIELMITVAIIGILAGLALTTFRFQQLRAKRTEGMTNVETIVKMSKAFYGDSGRYPIVGGTWPVGAPTPLPTPWDAASSAAFGEIGFRAEQMIRYRYDIDSGGECPCASGGCFTVIGYSDLEGDLGIGGVGYYHRDAALIECPGTLFGWLAPLDPSSGIPVYDSTVPFQGFGGLPLAADDF
ncbi:MAG TPA: prepilin-type N-terminal cleavage/methylation domain-containing protein [Myxococcota bacterium]|jgi:prepilin-type N-terminal cleavage/methylation domain-containing protein